MIFKQRFTCDRLIRRSLTNIITNESSITFIEKIQFGKSVASRSLVIEDGTTNLRHLWFKNDSAINQQLFDSKAESFIRWRINSNGSIQGGSHSKRFLLAQFPDDQQFADSCRYLRSKYGKNIIIDNNVCYINDSICPKLSSNEKIKLLIQPDIIAKCAINHYRIVKADNHQLIGQFDDYLLNSVAHNNYQQWLTRQTSPNNLIITHLIDKLKSGDDMIPVSQHRIRFFICNQLERMFNETFTNKTNQLIPFGSDVSGLGIGNDSDLDLCLKQNENEKKIRTQRSVRILGSLSSKMQSTIKMNDRIYIRHFPRLQRIFRAFVPIIKCHSRILPSVNVDISVDTECNSGIQMASYLHYCSNCCSPSIRSLILLLKCWAKHHGIIHSNPGEWFSSFQLTMLAIAYLQHEKYILSINDWQKQLNKIKNQSAEIVNELTLRELMYGFFQFVIDYNFWTKAIDLRTGRIDLEKPMTTKTSVCYIINPFINDLNITKTVSDVQLERFLCFCKQSLQLMQRSDFHYTDLFTNRINDHLQAFIN